MDSVNPDPVNIPDDDLQLQNYQDDLDTSSSIHDPVIDEETDDPTEELGVDPNEFKKELDQYVFGDAGLASDSGKQSDDRMEQLEDIDQDTDDHNNDSSAD